MDFIKNYIKNSIDTKRNILENEKILSKIRDVSLVIVDSLKKVEKFSFAETEAARQIPSTSQQNS